MACDFACQNFLKMVLQIVWVSVTCHRPGKPLTVRRRGLTRPSHRGSAEWAVILSPRTGGQFMKTGHRNSVITPKSEIFPWLQRLPGQIVLAISNNHAGSLLEDIVFGPRAAMGMLRRQVWVQAVISQTYSAVVRWSPSLSLAKACLSDAMTQISAPTWTLPFLKC